ncbi:MAG TPA: CoA transferase, partial [Acidimicrobiia bacterium]|nr:CoA transferase [Acidimicrobiia bacterium]
RLGVRERLGIAYETLRRVNPRIVSLSITGYGTTGPQAARPGFDPLLQAQSGLMQAQGGDGSEPVFHHIAVNDVGSAAMAALGIVAALVARTRTGEGQAVHTSLASQSVLLQIGELTTYPGAPAPPTGARDCTGAGALERYYECADGWIAVACATAREGAALADALGLEGLDVHAAMAEPAGGGVLAERIARVLEPLTVDDAVARLGDAGAPAVPVVTMDETFTDPYLEENGYYESYLDPASGPARGVAVPFRFGRSATAFPRAAPMLGEHGAEVLREYGAARG